MLKVPLIPDHPGPDEIGHFVNTLLDSGLDEADETLAYARLLLGQSFDKALGTSLQKGTGALEALQAKGGNLKPPRLSPPAALTGIAHRRGGLRRAPFSLCCRAGMTNRTPR